MNGLRISPDLVLPVDVAGEAIAILAKRGAGKTNTATVLVEELDRQKVQVVILDPVGAWWGIRSSADGKKPGISIAIFGGQHGDVPLEPTAGKLIADVVVDYGQSMLLDVSDFPSKASVARFVTDFAEQLYRRKGRSSSLLHLVLEEADLFAPQRVTGDAARMQAAIEQLVRRGRSRGIGLTMITQRSAVLSKDILTQADVLFAMRTTGPHDQKAIRAWVEAHDDDNSEVVDSLSSLETGEAWVWNPERGLLERVKIRARETFDSSRTPRAGETREGPKASAQIDLAALGAEIQATAERAMENDPAELRKKSREAEARAGVLERELADRPTIAQGRELQAEVDRLLQQLSDRPASRQVDRAAVEEVAELVAVTEDAIGKALESCRRVLTAVGRLLVEEVIPDPPGEGAAVPAATTPVAVREPDRGGTDHPAAAAAAPPLPVSTTSGEWKPTAPQQKILNALAALEAIGVGRPDKTQVALFAEASPKSSSYTNNLGALKNDKGLNPWPPLIGYPVPGKVALTPEGRGIANVDAAPSSSEEMHRYVYRLVTAPQSRILAELIAAYPGSLSREDLAARVDASPTSSSFTNNLGALRSLQLIDKQPGIVTALPVLFMDAS